MSPLANTSCRNLKSKRNEPTACPQPAPGREACAIPCWNVGGTLLIQAMLSITLYFQDERQRRQLLGKEVQPSQQQNSPTREPVPLTAETQVMEILRKIISQERAEAPSSTSGDSNSSYSSSLASLDHMKKTLEQAFPLPSASSINLQSTPASNDPDVVLDRRPPTFGGRSAHTLVEDAEGSQSPPHTPVVLPDPDVNEDIVLSQVCSQFPKYTHVTPQSNQMWKPETS